MNICFCYARFNSFSTTLCDWLGTIYVNLHSLCWMECKILTQSVKLLILRLHGLHQILFSRNTYFLVVWPTMSCFADRSKRRHVTLFIIEWPTHHGRPWVIIMINGHVMFTKCKHKIYSTLFLLIVSIFIKYSLNLLISAILQ